MEEKKLKTFWEKHKEAIVVGTIAVATTVAAAAGGYCAFKSCRAMKANEKHVENILNDLEHAKLDLRVVNHAGTPADDFGFLIRWKNPTDGSTMFEDGIGFNRDQVQEVIDHINKSYEAYKKGERA